MLCSRNPAYRYLDVLSKIAFAWKLIENLQVEYVICMEIVPNIWIIIKYKIGKSYKHMTKGKW